MRVGSLFTGYGGLDLAVEQFFGARIVWTCDNDPGACKIIAHRYPDIPNLGDITKVDWAAVEPIDILTGGWPCQPFSHAGKRLGAADERALWPEVARAVRTLRPRYVVLENVAAIASAGELARAAGDLATLGFVGSWRSLRAADVGAPHGRLRTFILAENTESAVSGERWLATPGQTESGRARADAGRRDRASTADAEGPERWPGQDDEAAVRAQGHDQLGRGSPCASGLVEVDQLHVGHSTSIGNGVEVRSPCTRDEVDADGGELFADDGLDHAEILVGLAGGYECENRHVSITTAGPMDDNSRRERTFWGDYEPAIRRWERILGRPAPAPTETGPKGGQRLAPRFVEFLMGLPAGWVTDVPGLSRNAQLKALGNGVVPQQPLAALAALDEGRCHT